MTSRGRRSEFLVGVFLLLSVLVSYKVKQEKKADFTILCFSLSEEKIEQVNVRETI